MAVTREWIGSPNFSPGRAGYRPRAVVIHIMQGTLAETDSWFGTTRSEVSAHYAVAADGRVHQYVQEGDTAWHAGRVVSPTWPLLKPGVNPNLYTIGIEHEGWSGRVWTDATLQASASLLAESAKRWRIPLDRLHVIGHCDIDALKPFCPGTGVDLDELVRLAQERAVAASSFNFVAHAGQTTTTTRVNVRFQAPLTSAPLVRTTAGAEPFVYAGWTSDGESVHGNSHWYRDANGDYLWAGGTVDPSPA
jgi:Negative regulator of beta-lactamase expression